MLDRMIRVAKLDRSVFAEVEQDPAALTQAVMVVAIVAIAGVIGSLGRPGPGILGALIEAFFYWFLWSYLTSYVGRSLYKAQVTPQETLRTLGFATAPRVLSIFRLIPVFGWLFVVAGALLSLVAGFLAAQEALDLDTGSTLVTIVISWLVAALISAILLVLL